MNSHHEIDVFFDGACPLCAKEIRFIAGRDTRCRVGFIDIAAKNFDAADYGLRRDDFMARIKGRLPDGTMIDGVEVFRRLYTAIGFGWLVALTRIPGISNLVELGYSWFAANRLRLTGRCGDTTCEIAMGESA